MDIDHEWLAGEYNRLLDLAEDEGKSCTYRKRGAMVKLYDERTGYWGSTMTWG